MHFRSVADLNTDIHASLHLFPRDIDAVIGIPRSGMLPAAIIALALNVPLGDLHGFARGRLLGVGSKRTTARSSAGFADVQHALVVDDSIDSGSSMAEAKEIMSASAKRLTFCAVYAASARQAAVDLTLSVLPRPRVFEWNVLHHPILERSCVDIDGLLCQDPLPHENDDGPAYLRFLLEADPRWLPSMKINALVTSRLEKYRSQTEAWLARHGVQYGKLVMLQNRTAQERHALGLHGSFKAAYYRDTPTELFIESSFGQAQEIARLSGKPVLSMEGPIMCYPDPLSATAIDQRFKRVLHQGTRERVRAAVARSVRNVVGEATYRRLRNMVRP